MYYKSLRKKKEKAQGLAEYALIMVLVAIVVIAVLTVLGPLTGSVFSTINSSLSNQCPLGGDYVFRDSYDNCVDKHSEVGATMSCYDSDNEYDENNGVCNIYIQRP